MDEWDWPEGLDLWDLVDISGQGQVLINAPPFNEQWTSEPASVIALRHGQRPPSSAIGPLGAGRVRCARRGSACGAGWLWVTARPGAVGFAGRTRPMPAQLAAVCR